MYKRQGFQHLDGFRIQFNARQLSLKLLLQLGQIDALHMQFVRGIAQLERPSHDQFARAPTIRRKLGKLGKWPTFDANVTEGAEGVEENGVE